VTGDRGLSLKTNFFLAVFNSDCIIVHSDKSVTKAKEEAKMGFQRERGGGGGGFGDRPREMHKAVCADCKRECEVPFKPSGDRPVYCKDCFAKRKNQDR
jgi:CxxC-x17-CxxC domain-containing protein